MNKETRKQLSKLRDKVDSLKSQLLDLSEQVQEIRDEEDEKYYNLPDSLQESKVGKTIMEGEESLDEIIYNFEQVESEFDTLLESFEELIG
ncbi:MAG: hypothetical protein II304_00075 [Bacteroidales bacterium]|nr:hypothetical protein [Bacteroidales bacterium]